MTFKSETIKSKTINDRAAFKVSLVKVTKDTASILVSAVGNPPQGEVIEIQSSEKRSQPWKHTVWIKQEMHEDFFRAYLDMIKAASWNLPNHELIEQLAKENDLGKRKIDLKEIIENPDQIRDIMDRIGEIRDGQTKNFRKDLNQFELLLKQRSGETGIHNFLKERPWIFGIDYIGKAVKDRFQVQFGEFDFLLERFNKVYDIIELKGVDAEVFEEYRSNKSKQGERVRWKISEHLSGAIMQVLDYFEEFEEAVNEKNRSKRGLKNYRNPRGQIIIGHRDDLKSKEEKKFCQTSEREKLLTQLNQKFNNIEILTFSDLYERAENFLELLESSILTTNNDKVC